MIVKLDAIKCGAITRLWQSLLHTLILLALADVAVIGAPEDRVRDSLHIPAIPTSDSSVSSKLKSFNLSAEELAIAWDEWHKRLSREVTRRLNKHTSRMALGSVLARITINKDKQITAAVLNSSGNKRIAQGFVKAIESLNGNEELLFPSKSQREKITFDYSFKRSLFGLPKHEWIRNDIELVDEER